jgi:adenine-specific DNA-methyltransferase
MAKPPTPKSVDAIQHDDAKRKNIPTAEYQSVLDEAQKNPRHALRAPGLRNRLLPA